MTSANPFEEVERVLERADSKGVVLRAVGGVAVGLRCPSALRAPLARSYNDLDFVAAQRQSGLLDELFRELGYEPEEQFNALNGQDRMFFLDKTSGREADVFIGTIRGCHQLDVGGRLQATTRTLALADLLLSKLQVRETNRKDHLDIFALLVDHSLTDDDDGISRNRVTEVCCSDWGWWRTVTEVVAAAEPVAAATLPSPELERVSKSLHDIGQLLEEAPKSRRWRLRAKLGERVQWYESPEEADHRAT